MQRKNVFFICMPESQPDFPKKNCNFAKIITNTRWLKENRLSMEFLLPIDGVFTGYRWSFYELDNREINRAVIY